MSFSIGHAQAGADTDLLLRCSVPLVDAGPAGPAFWQLGWAAALMQVHDQQAGYKQETCVLQGDGNFCALWLRQFLLLSTALAPVEAAHVLLVSNR